MIKYIIFDVGGILFQNGPTHLAVELSREIIGKLSDEGEKEYLHFRPLMQTGRMKTRDFFTHLVRKYKLKRTVDTIASNWLSFYAEIAVLNKEIVDLICNLKKTYTVCGFSNTIDIHGDYNKSIGNYSVLDRIFLSYEIGFRKPDREAYEFVLSFLKARPEECVFIDDREENIAAAENLGIKTILFLNNKQLKKKLKDLGI